MNLFEQLGSLNMDFSFSDTIREAPDYKHELKTGKWKETECDDRVEEDQKVQNGVPLVKFKTDETIDDDESSKVEIMPSHLGTFVFSHSNKKRIILKT